MRRNYEAYEIDMKTLGFYVDRLLYAMKKWQNKELKKINSDLQQSEFVTLKMINRLGEASQSQIAAIMGKERSGISRILASLEKKGYIIRSAVNGTTNKVMLSEKGKEIRPLLSELSDQLTELSFKGFSANSRNLLLKNLERIYKNVTSED